MKSLNVFLMIALLSIMANCKKSEVKPTVENQTKSTLAIESEIPEITKNNFYTVLGKRWNHYDEGMGADSPAIFRIFDWDLTFQASCIYCLNPSRPSYYEELIGGEIEFEPLSSNMKSRILNDLNGKTLLGAAKLKLSLYKDKAEFGGGKPDQIYNIIYRTVVTYKDTKTSPNKMIMYFDSSEVDLIKKVGSDYYTYELPRN